MSDPNYPRTGYPSPLDGARRSYDPFGLSELGPEEYELTPGRHDEEWPEEEGRFARARAIAHTVGGRLAWLGLAALIALGSAGIVAATGRSPQNDGRPELTYAADQALTARLDTAVRDLARLNEDVVYLGTLTRDVLSDLSQLNQKRLASDYQDGDATIASIDQSAADLSERLQCSPWPDSRDAALARTYSQAGIARWHQVCDALVSVTPLADDWSAMVSGSKVVIEVTDDISAHDDAATAALQQATAGRYPEALAQLATADTSLSDADRIAATMAKVGDVSTLTTWLKRTRDVDDALALLWQMMIDSKGRVTPQVTAALKNVNEAKALLPNDNSILQVVIYELAGNLTAHGISIETAKGQLATALDQLTEGTVTGG